MSSQPEFDIIIVGGGLAGASLAVALCKEDIRIALVEAVEPKADFQPSFDDRGLALSTSSIRILQTLAIWEEIVADAAVIKGVHVTEQHRFGGVRLHAQALDLPYLGYVVLAKKMGKAVMGKLGRSKQVNYICPSQVNNISIHDTHVEVSTNTGETEMNLTGKLLVAADGTSSTVRELLGIAAYIKDYNQTAIVTNIIPGKPHQGIAYERFTLSGPLALLPLPDQRCSVVMTVNSGEEQYYLQLDEEEFLLQLQDRFGKRLGVFHKMGKRYSYPIKQVIATRQVLDRVVILGNSAHTIHPNSAQGFNLCLRDVAGLVETLAPVIKTGQDIGKLQVLDEYLKNRQADQETIVNFTDGLAWLFYNKLPHRLLLRNIGMHVIEKVPMVKRKLINRISGLSGLQPVMVRE